ncbi:MAG TPA: tetratricopeptide repeat protein [Tepidisphaeraceae bacterium]|jgi:Tfp pilus assembly protein PilF
MKHFTPTACSIALLITLSGCAGGSAESRNKSKLTAVEQYVEGYKAYKEGDTAKAKSSLEGAVEANPDLRMARTILGEIYRKENDFNAAAEQYEVLSRIDPYTLSNHYYLGVSYQFLTKYRDAITAYLRGLKLDTNDFKTNMNLGTVHLAIGEVDSAVNYLDKATQLDPQSGVAWSNLGVALDARGSLVLAETAYRKAVEREPESLAMMQNLANNLLAQKKSGEAVYLWEQIVAESRTPFTQTRLGESLAQAQDFAKANEQFDAVLKEDPRYIPAINGKANALIRQYELSGFINDQYRTEALKLLRNSLSLNSKQPRVGDLVKKYESSSAIKP